MSAGSVFRDLLVGHVAPAALPALVAYAELLDRWSDRHNLVRFASPRELVERHLLDAVEGTRLLAGEGRLLDVGSGAGLPGVPLLITRPAWRGVLLEPRQKRWAFLKRVVRELGLDAEAVLGRTDDFDPEEPFDLITARAVGAHGELLRWARTRLRSGGKVAVWTTAGGERELTGEPGWRVLSWPLVGLDRGRLVACEPEGSCST